MGIPISNVTRRVVYAASGTGPYNFTFEILAAGDVAVYKDDVLLTITTDYTVTINANGTGYITLTASPTGATQIAIVGNRTIQRTTDFVTGGDFFANTVNTELDSLTIFAQQNAESVDRAMKAPQTDPTSINMTLPRASLRAGKTLAFDAQGNPSLGDTLGTNRGNWASGTLYYVRDIVKDTTTSNIWQCLVQHTSSGSQPISTNADAAKWSLLVDAAAAGASATAAAASASAAATSASNASTSATNAASSASTASTQASNASTSATNAANSATAAASSASTASTAATNAGNSATAAATSATNASNSASSASTSATNASNSATSAATSASQASTSASNAAGSATTATTQATNASNSASAAATSATNAATSATNAANSATSAASSLTNFRAVYLGSSATNPTVDGNGNALSAGDLYFNTVANEMRVYNGSTWQAASTVGGTVTSLNVTGNTTLGDAAGDTVTVNGTATFANANPTLSAGTANGVAYLNGSKVLTTGSALTFDGTTLGVGALTVNSNNISAVNSLGFRNRIINGDMRIDQRNAGAGVSSSGSFPVDRFKVFRGAAGTFTAQQSTVAPAGFRSSLLYTVGNGAAPGASDFGLIQQPIEGFNVADLGFGTVSAQSVTLSFWVRSSVTGTFGFSLRNSTPNRSYVGSYTINAANTWEYKTVTVAGDTTGTWETNQNTGIILDFDLGVGSSLSTTAGSWQAGNFIGLTGGAKLNATAGATFYITGVQLEAGSVATPFERRDYGRELMMCQRYYWQTASSTQTQFLIYSSGTATNYYQYIPFSVQMRATPTTAVTGSPLYSNASGAVYNQPDASGASLNFVSGTGTGRTGAYNLGLSASAEL